MPRYNSGQSEGGSLRLAIAIETEGVSIPRAASDVRYSRTEFSTSEPNPVIL